MPQKKPDRKRSVTALLAKRRPDLVHEAFFLVRDEYAPERFKQRARGLDAVWEHAGECEFFILRDLFGWFGPAMVEAGWPNRSAELDKILQRARAEWTSLTTLPPLCTEAAWRAAAYVVGYSRKELRNLKLGKLAEELVAWARSKRANHSAEAGEIREPLTEDALLVLQALKKTDPVLCLLLSICSETKRTDKTARKTIRKLKAAGLIHQPNGPRSGYGLTDKGRQLLKGSG